MGHRRTRGACSSGMASGGGQREGREATTYGATGAAVGRRSPAAGVARRGHRRDRCRCGRGRGCERGRGCGRGRARSVLDEPTEAHEPEAAAEGRDRGGEREAAEAFPRSTVLVPRKGPQAQEDHHQPKNAEREPHPPDAIEAAELRSSGFDARVGGHLRLRAQASRRRDRARRAVAGSGGHASQSDVSRQVATTNQAEPPVSSATAARPRAAHRAEPEPSRPPATTTRVPKIGIPDTCR